MRGTISCGCFHPTVGHHVDALDRNDKGKACTSCYQNTSTCRPRKEKFQKLKTRVSRKFWEKSNCLTDSSCFQKAHRSASLVPHAVMITSPKPEQTKKFNIDGQSELEIQVTGPDSILSRITVRIYNGSPTLVLHWGAIRSGQKSWSLPSCQPQGTKVYKNRALRTPFVKSGPNSLLEIEVNDPEVEAIEFLLVDEAENKWFKNGGGNFRIELERKSNQDIPISIPQELLQIQAYLRWERMGKQNYTPEREKEEFEAARRELIDKVIGGASIDDIRAELTGKNTTTTTTPKEDPRSSGKDIPNDLIQIQAYIRWEKAGKPTYSKEKQLVEFEEAKRDLEMEIAKGTSLEQIRKRMLKGDIETKVSKQLKKGYFSPERINRKKRDINKLITKYRTDSIHEKLFAVPTSLTPLERYSMSLEEQFGDKILNKKFFQIDGGQLLVLVTKSGGAIKAYIAADAKEPLILHWALSETPGEWKRPPLSILPPGSVLLEKASESEFQEGSSGDLSFKYMEIEFTEGGSVGMPFVLRSGEKWIKNSGSDFYVEFASDTLKARKSLGDGKGTAKALLNKIAQMESDAERSLMHRFNIANDLTQSAKNEGMLGIAAILVWMRFMATRQLTWNKNYNVKPREISRAQDSLTDSLQKIYQAFPQCREIVRMILSTVGRGGQGDVGQRIRDEILVIQRNNDCKGGMMEEWHQKLHNNTSPDDVVICQALLDYISSDFDFDVYWKTLNSNGITKERLLSYDRAIHSEPNFKHDQKEGLIRDLKNYLRTLKAVHSGADLESAVATCMGYNSEGQGFMVGVEIHPVKGLPSGFPELLQFVLDHVEDKEVEPLLEGLLEARVELRPMLLGSHDRLKDLIFLDLALDSAVRTATERSYETLNNAGPQKIMYITGLLLENLALSSDDNEDLIFCLKGWNCASEMLKAKDAHWALYAKSVLDRIRLALTNKAENYHQILQPSAEYLGGLLGVDQWAVNIFTEEIIRAGSAASLSMLLNRIDPILRKEANLGSWQIISPVEVKGTVVVVDELLSVQNKVYDKPTILITKRVKGEEEIPDGAVAVLTPDMPDVLSHVSVRARNSKVCFATSFDSGILTNIQAMEGKTLYLKPTSSDLLYGELKDAEVFAGKSSALEGGAVPSLTLVPKKFLGKYAISANEFSSEMVGAKSRNIAYLKGKVPSWVGIPTSVALPFGTFEKVLCENENKAVSDKLSSLRKKLSDSHGDSQVLHEIRETVLQLSPPSLLVQELKNKMQDSGMPWPGSQGEGRWDRAWEAIKKVWASKWNERAYFSTRKVKLDHDSLCMAVLVQEIINADYAFVIHTTNPSSGDTSEIYAEVVKGLGETLVGAYPGRAVSFTCKKADLDSPKISGYPSKPIGLFIKPSIIFRSDSNGEDLEGYAGAGLYDSVPMDEEEKVVLDYSADPLLTDRNFQKSILSAIARAGSAIEELYGSPQDIEGVVKDGKVFVVQTRPQM